LLAGVAFLFSLASLALASPSPLRAALVAGPTADGYVRAHRPVSTSDAAAQAAFDDGLTLLYAFNPEQARVSFEQALAADPHLALAWWGVAMSHGVNINLAFEASAQRQGRDAIAKARALESYASPVERALIEAAAQRFAFVRDADADRSARAYRDAMYATASDYPNDDDVAVLAAEAEMDVHPWSYFDEDGTATAGTSGIVSRLETVLARTPAHIGAEHLIIHALEESKDQGPALDAARRLAADRFEPAAEHLTHMPSHTFMRVGLYHEAGLANARAVDSYHVYLANAPAGHADYLGHDCVFGVDAFMLSGEYARARALALACNDGAGGLLAAVDLRFARYDALAQDRDPGAFAAGMLAVHDGREAVATAQLTTLRAEKNDTGRIETALLEAALEALHGDRNAEIAALERAAAVQDREGYSEPPDFWMNANVRLGAADYRAGRFAAAERAFRAALAQERDDPRALFGLARTLEREGRADDARATDIRFRAAWGEADSTLDMNDL
jgi:Tfp pilus assembly protein PilF